MIKPRLYGKYPRNESESKLMRITCVYTAQSKSDPIHNVFAFVAGSKLMRIAEQKCIGSLRARVNGRLIRNAFCIGSKVIRYSVNGVLVRRS